MGFDGVSTPFPCQMCRIEILASEAQEVCTGMLYLDGWRKSLSLCGALGEGLVYNVQPSIICPEASCPVPFLAE